MGTRRTKGPPKRPTTPLRRKSADVLVRAIRQHLRSAHPKLSERGIATLARRFLMAGRAAVHTTEGSLRDSAEAMGFHRRMLAASRQRVAHHSNPGADAFRSNEFRKIHDTLVHHWPRLRTVPNVVGFAAGFRFIAGIATDERCASILVSTKYSQEQLRRSKEECLPKTLRRAGHSVPVDVIEIGEFKLHAGPGACIAPQADSGRRSTLGVYATDNHGGGALALTAMHAAGNDIPIYPPDTGAAAAVPFVTLDGDSQTLLGNLLRGTRRNGIDAAAISLADGQEMCRVLPGVGEVTSWRRLVQEHDFGIPVTLCGAQSGMAVHGTISNPCAYLPEHNLGPAILASIPAIGGDSGGALVDQNNFLLGLLVGGGDSIQFFSPMANIFNELSCDLF
jgi:hypothetical protein